jgi:hypothetical protein
MDRQFVWSDPIVQKLAARFVPAADASDRLQSKSCKDADAVLFQKFGGRRTMPSQRAGDGLGQGQYAVAPSGELLASCATADPREVAQMLRTGLERWNRLSRAQRLLPKPPDAQSAARWRRSEGLYPEDGLVLHVVSRDLPREKIPAHFRNAWNQDYAWFRKAEARAFLPPKLTAGAHCAVPRDLVDRLAQFHLIDNVRGLNYAYFPRDAVEKALLTATIVRVSGDVVSVRFEGHTRAAVSVPDKHGYEAKLLGSAQYDRKRQSFAAFELVAVGTRWGAGNCNLRTDDLGPAPLGIALTLAGHEPAERLPPAFIRQYGW